MRNRRLPPLLGLLGVILLAAWFFGPSTTPKSDEARYRRLGRAARLSGWLNSVNHELPRPITRLFRLGELEKRYVNQYDADFNALVSSGHLRRVTFTVTNLAQRTQQIHNTLIENLKGSGYWEASYQVASDQVIVYCRPQQVPRLQGALGF